jgi:hypothetical protein
MPNKVAGQAATGNVKSLKIFLAGEIDNPYIKEILAELKHHGHAVYWFGEGDVFLDYNKIEMGFRSMDANIQASYINHPLIEKACKINDIHVRNCDVFIIAEPAGNGSWAEFGLAVGLGKTTVLCVTPHYRIGVMDRMFSFIAHDLKGLIDLLSN